MCSKRSWLRCDATHSSIQIGGDVSPRLETAPAFAQEGKKGAGINSTCPNHTSQVCFCSSDLCCWLTTSDQPDASYGQDLDPAASVLFAPSCPSIV